jgi:eukaryotic-like serine/threonine-protein kinase
LINWRGGARRALPYAVVAAFGFLVAYLIVAFFLFPVEIIPDDEVVPNVVGSSYEEASQRLSAAGFRAARGETRMHATVPARTVLEQAPAGGSRQRSGTVIVLHLSSGPRTSMVPMLRGTTRETAERVLLDAGFDVTVEEVLDSGLPDGSVIGSAPESGARLSVPATVTLRVSSGPTRISMPNLIGGTLVEARNVLDSTGLRLGPVNIDPFSIQLPNTVLSQDPEPGVAVSPGTVISLRVAGRAE